MRSQQRSFGIRRSIARNSIFAAAVSIAGAQGFHSLAKERTEFASLVAGFVAAFIYFWVLRVGAALLEFYITRGRSRRWIYWPHVVAAAVVVFSVAGDNSHIYRGDNFVDLVTLRAVTFALLEYLLCALIFLSITATIVWIKQLVQRHSGIAVSSVVSATSERDSRILLDHTSSRSPSSRRSSLFFSDRVPRLSGWILRRSSGPDNSPSAAPVKTSSWAIWHPRVPSRDAAALALSITTAIASLVQGFDTRNVARTAIALLAGIAGLYLLRRLPEVPRVSEETKPEGESNYDRPNKVEIYHGKHGAERPYS
jgi:hypothetical protein